MKKKLRIVAVTVLVCFCMVWFVGCQPFRNLSVDEIKRVTLQIHPLTSEIELEEQEIGEMVEVLRDVRIYNPTLRNLFSGGMACVYTITFRDGTVREVVGYNPTVILDGISFRSEYTMSDRLCDLAHTIADTQFK